jgi:hypothetical protein
LDFGNIRFRGEVVEDGFFELFHLGAGLLAGRVPDQQQLSMRDLGADSAAASGSPRGYGGRGGCGGRRDLRGVLQIHRAHGVGVRIGINLRTIRTADQHLDLQLLERLVEDRFANFLGETTRRLFAQPEDIGLFFLAPLAVATDELAAGFFLGLLERVRRQARTGH